MFNWNFLVSFRNTLSGIFSPYPLAYHYQIFSNINQNNNHSTKTLKFLEKLKYFISIFHFTIIYQTLFTTLKVYKNLFNKRKKWLSILFLKLNFFKLHTYYTINAKKYNKYYQFNLKTMKVNSLKLTIRCLCLVRVKMSLIYFK